MDDLQLRAAASVAANANAQCGALGVLGRTVRLDFQQFRGANAAKAESAISDRLNDP